jgi:ribonuclease P protein component
VNAAPKESQVAQKQPSEAPQRFPFPRTAKLLKHSDFQRVYKGGKRHFSALMTVFYQPSQQLEVIGPRVGFTVGRVLGGAVVRNRIKRRMREAVRVHLAELPASVDVIFNPKKLVLTAEFSQIDQEVKRAFEVIHKNVGRLANFKPRSKEDEK